MACVPCKVSHIPCHLAPTPTATATDPPPNNSPTMHSRLVHQDRTKKTKIIYKLLKKIIQTF